MPRDAFNSRTGVSRRQLLGAMVAAPLSVVNAVPASAQPKGATFVLVHGAWHGGWCWKKLTPLLCAAGHTIYTPPLTGVGERAHLLTPDIGLDTHITDIVNVLEYEDLREIVLVGHSYGGMVIAGVAERVPHRL